MGGGIWFGAGASGILTNDTVNSNAAVAGDSGTAASVGYSGSDGVGEGGGLYIDPNGKVTLDSLTKIKKNTASTNGNQIYSFNLIVN